MGGFFSECVKNACWSSASQAKPPTIACHIVLPVLLPSGRCWGDSVPPTVDTAYWWENTAVVGIITLC